VKHMVHVEHNKIDVIVSTQVDYLDGGEA